MTFNNPWGLLGLISIPVILALHMFRERQNRYVVSSLKLWDFLEPEVHGNKARRIPFSWLLVLDLLAAILLSLAWSQPSIDIPLPVKSGRHVILLMDNSTSMLARDVNPDRLSVAKREASTLLNSLGPQDMATVITFGAQTRIIGDSRQDDLNTLLETISDLTAGGSGQPLQEALMLAEAVSDRDSRPEYHVLSDGSQSLQLSANPGQNIVWHTIGISSDNQAVMDIDVVNLSPRQYQVYARFANYADSEANRLVSVVADGNPLNSAMLDLSPHTSTTRVWGPFNGEPSSVSVTLLGGDNLPEDDSAASGLQAGQTARVALIADTSFPLQEAIEAVPGTELTTYTTQNYLPNLPADLSIFRNTIPNVLPAGTTLFIDPQVQSSEMVLALEISGPIDIKVNALTEISSTDALVEDIDFNGVRWEYITGLASVPETFEVIIQIRDPNNQTFPVLLKDTSKKSAVYVLLADLQHGNFAQHPAFPIMIGNAVNISAYDTLPAAIKAGEDLALPEPGKYRALSIKAPKAETATFINTWPDVWSLNQTPGVLEIEFEDTAGIKSSMAVGINAGNPLESDLSVSEPAQPAEASLSGSDVVGKGEMVNLTPWLLGLAMIILFMEAMLAWR